MLQFRTCSLTLAVSALVFSSCGKKSDSSEAPRKTNSTTAAEFKDRNTAAMAQVGKASALTVPKSQKSKTKAGASAFISEFIGSVSDTSQEPGKDCEMSNDFSGLGDSFENSKGTTEPGGLNLTDGEDCEQALNKIRSSYDYALKLVKAQNAFLTKLDGKTTFCGMKVAKLDVNPEEAAMGYTLSTNINKYGAKADVAFDLKGGAIENTVNFIGGLRVKGTYTGGNQSGIEDREVPTQPSGMSAAFDVRINQQTGIETALETLDSTFDISGTVSLSQGAEQSGFSLGGSSVSKIYGLKDGQTPTATETANLTFQVNAGQGRSGTVTFQSNLKAQKLDAKTMQIDGSYSVSNPNGQGTQTYNYALNLERNGDTCAIHNRGKR